MTPEEIDRLLANWKVQLDLASQNLLALQDLTTYQQLAGEAGLPKAQLTGTTAVQVAAALEAVNQVFQNFDLLLAIINQAGLLRKQLPRFLGGDRHLEAVETLLLGPSVHLAVNQVPLAQRSLLSATETTCMMTPNDLLGMMIHSFEMARDVILAVDAVWSRLEPKLAQTERGIQTLQEKAERLKVNNLTDLQAVSQAIAKLREQVTTDPLGVRDEFEQQIQPIVTRIEETLDRAWHQSNRVREALAKARTLFQHLTELNQQAKATYQESLEKILDCSGLLSPVPEDRLDALNQWLSRLETRFAEGLVDPILVGVENWTVKVEAEIAIARQALTANSYPLETCRELRGRLEALKAKALARGQAEDPVLSDLSVQAKQILYTRPTDLAKATELVTQYEKYMNRR